MTVHAVYISTKNRDGAAFDVALRGLFAEVYRIWAEFWLVDALADAEDVARAVRTRFTREDKVFVAALTRDVWSGLSMNARSWLTAPTRSWGQRVDGLGIVPVDAEPAPLALALLAA